MVTIIVGRRWVLSTRNTRYVVLSYEPRKTLFGAFEPHLGEKNGEFCEKYDPAKASLKIKKRPPPEPTTDSKFKYVVSTFIQT